MEMINQFRTLITVLFAHRQKQENTERVENGEEATLRLENEELKRTIDTLTIKNREIQQLMVHKIRETDDWGHEHEAKYKEAIRRADELEKLHNSFFVEAVHEMRTPLSLILGYLGQLVQNRELDGLVSTQVLSAYRNTLALQDMMYPSWRRCC